MNQEQLYRKLVDISDVDDFVLELKPIYSSTYWGRYFPQRKLIRLYALDEYGRQFDDEILIREGIHELTHHIQHHHIPYWRRIKGVMHDAEFFNIYNGMMSRATVSATTYYHQNEYMEMSI